MLLLSTSSLRGYSLHHSDQIARAAGYDGLDLVLDPSEYDTLDVEYLKSLVKSGVTIASITTYERKMSMESATDALSIAVAVGAKVVNFFPPHRLDKSPEWFPNGIKELQKQYPDIALSVVNVEPKTLFWIVPEYREARPDALKKITGSTSLDVGRVDESSGMTLMKTLTLMGSSIQHVYLSDRSETKSGLLLGKWHLPLESFLKKLVKGGYTGLYTVNIDGKQLGGSDKERVIERLIETREFISAELGRE